MRWIAALLALASLGIAAPGHAQSERLSNWSAAIVQADWRDSRGHRIAAFDNARRDLEAGFRSAGLTSVRAFNLDGEARGAVAPQDLSAQLQANAQSGSAGCLVYFTSHGAPDAMVFGDAPRLAPDGMTRLIRNTCGTKPTVVVVSACFSGIFVDSLRAPNRMILTAARRDRSSFGCGANEQYPWFDGCVIESLPKASDFIALANLTRTCVSRKETELGAAPASEPQLLIGADMQMLLPTLRFRQGAG